MPDDTPPPDDNLPGATAPTPAGTPMDALDALAEQATALVGRILQVGIHGTGPFKGAVAIAEDYTGEYRTAQIAVDKLIEAHARRSAATGFATGLGGIATLALTIPADLVSLYILQGRMAAAIGHIRGHDLAAPETQSIVLLSLLGSGATAVLSHAGIDLCDPDAASRLRELPRESLLEINRTVGVRLLTKAGGTGIINVGKVIPIIGGIAGAGVNYTTTKTVGDYAARSFPQLPPPGGSTTTDEAGQG